MTEERLVLAELLEKAGEGDFAAPGQHLPALRSRSLGPPVEAAARGPVAVVRYADDFVMGFEKAADARRMLVELKDRLAKFGLALHEDKTRLIEFGRLPALQRRAARRAAAGNLRLSRLHPLLRVDTGWPVHCEAQDAEQAPDAQADGAAPGGLAAHARADGRAATLVRQRPARPLRLLWAAEQLPRAERVSPGESGASGSAVYGGAVRRPGAWPGTASKRCSSAFLCHCLGSLILGRRRRHDAGYPREEPGAGKPHARICEGESRMAELLDHNYLFIFI